eukprot:505569_1
MGNLYTDESNNKGTLSSTTLESKNAYETVKTNENDKFIDDENEDDGICEVCVTGSDERRRIWHCSARKEDDIVKCIGRLRIRYNKQFKPHRVKAGTGTIFAVNNDNCYILTAAHNIRGAIYRCRNPSCVSNGILSMVKTCDKCGTSRRKQKPPQRAEEIVFERRGITKETFGEHEQEYECDLKQILFEKHLEQYDKLSVTTSGNDICILVIHNESAANYYRNKCKNIYLVNNENKFSDKHFKMHLFGYPRDKQRDGDIEVAEMWGMSTTKGNDFEIRRNRKSLQKYFVNKEIDTKPGQSGACVYYCENEEKQNKFMICGVHCGGNDEKKENYGTILDYYYLRLLQQYFKDKNNEIYKKIICAKREHAKDVFDDDKKQENDAEIELFQFGELFDYWNGESGGNLYIVPEHKSLKDEVTNSKNDVYINEVVWNEFVNKAKQKYDVMYGSKDSKCAIYAKHKLYYNKMSKIAAGSKMTMDHILAVMIYANVDDLQKYLKEQSRKMNCDESVTDVAIKNRKYANWFRLLREVVWLFGDELEYNKSLWFGINHKVLFNQLECEFKAPFSATNDHNIAADCCKDNGVILEVTNAESCPQPYFNLAGFGDSKGSQYLFFAATLKITSVVMHDSNSATYLNCKKQIDVLNFYLNIMNGNEIDRYASTFSKDHSEHINKLSVLCKETLKLVNKHIVVLNGDDTAEIDYMWRVFVNFTKINDMIWINKNKLRYLKNQIKCENDENIDLVSKFIVFGDNGNDELGEYLKVLLNKNPKLKINYAVEWEWNIKQKELNQLKNGKTGPIGIVCLDYWDYFIDNDKNKMCSFGGNMVDGYYDNDSKQMDDDTIIDKQVGFYWRLTSLPKKYKSVMVSVELYCPQIGFYIQFFDIEMKKNSQTGNTSLFPISKLNKMDSFKWRIIVKCKPVENEL